MPLRKTAKTTLFYTKPKEAPKDTDTVLKSSTSPASEGTPAASESIPPVTASEPHVVEQDNGTTAPSERSPGAASSSQQESSVSKNTPRSATSGTRGREEGETHAPALDSSAAQEPIAKATQEPASSDVHEGTPVADLEDQQPAPAAKLEPTAEHTQGDAGQLDSGQQPAVSARFRQDNTPPAVKVTPRVKRPWEQVPKAPVPLVVAEGAVTPSIGRSACSLLW